MSNNWVVENLENALETWNSKLSEIWRLLSESPTEFKGGGIWNVMVNINDALKAVGYALLVLFFLMGIMRQFNSFQEIKRPEQALKLFIRFVLAKAAVTWGLDLMMAMFTIVQGIISKIMIAPFPLRPEAIIIFDIIPCTMVNIAIIRSSPQVTAAFASTKRIKSFRACSGRLISWKELN